jgi:DNA-binding transcriptional ArsR family regulator
MKIKAEEMRAAAGAAEELLKALANRHRLMILCHLAGGERSVGELAEFLDLRDSTASQHLALLRKDGLVEARREGQTIWYSLASQAAEHVIESLYRIYCAPRSACRPPNTRKAKSVKPATRKVSRK